MTQTRRTKIIATVGPSSSSEESIRALITAGTNVFRLNFSHGTAEEQGERAASIRRIAHELETHVAILGDLQGPKIRICGFRDGAINLQVGQPFSLDTELAADAGDATQVGVLYKQLSQDCKPGDRLLLDDGRLELDVLTIEGSRLNCSVVVGGKLSNNKGINLAGGGLSAPALTEKDYADIKTIAKLELDLMAVSFPRSARDMEHAREVAREAGFQGGLVAKIERSELVQDDQELDALIEASDAVMVARGDLGVEVGDAQLVGIQKHIILRARQLNRVVITATQMMESMIDNLLPTRAEVFDVANAVLDGTDAVMLSGETAVGKHPAKVVEAMARVILGAESQRSTKKSQHRLQRQFESVDETIAMAAMYAANHMGNTKAIISLTESGNTPLLMSRIRSGIPIYALSSSWPTLRRCCLIRGVRPVEYDHKNGSVADIIVGAMEMLKEMGILDQGDRILVTVGDLIGESGYTNTLKILKV